MLLYQSQQPLFKGTAQANTVALEQMLQAGMYLLGTNRLTVREMRVHVATH
jgi:hypothetical protein